MGHSSNRNRIPGDFSRAMATLVDESKRAAGFARRDFFAQAFAFQAHGHVRCGEAHQRRRFMVEPDRARLSLLVATVADGHRLVCRSKSWGVQKILGRVLSGGRNHRSIFHLGAATIAIARVRLVDFSSDRDRCDRQLLLFQSADDRVVLVAR